MAIVKPRRVPLSRQLPTVPLPPMRAVRASKLDNLNRWLAVAELKGFPERFMRSPLPDDQAMVEVYVSSYPVCLLSLCCNISLIKLYRLPIGPHARHKPSTPCPWPRTTPSSRRPPICTSTALLVLRTTPTRRFGSPESRRDSSFAGHSPYTGWANLSGGKRV